MGGRPILLALLAIGLGGTAAELALIGHHEDGWQRLPFVVIGLGLASIVLHAFSPGAGTAVFRAAMLALIACGLTGMALHYEGAREFQTELDPSIGGPALFWKAVRAKTPPALAPGSLVFFGLMGLAAIAPHSAGATPASAPETRTPK